MSPYREFWGLREIGSRKWIHVWVSQSMCVHLCCWIGSSPVACWVHRMETLRWILDGRGCFKECSWDQYLWKGRKESTIRERGKATILNNESLSYPSRDQKLWWPVKIVLVMGRSSSSCTPHGPVDMDAKGRGRGNGRCNSSSQAIFIIPQLRATSPSVLKRNLDNEPEFRVSGF